MSKINTYQLKNNAKDITYKIFRAVLLFGLCFLILQPLLDKVSVSLMEHDDLYDPTVISIPRHFSTEFYGIAMQIWKSNQTSYNKFNYMYSVFQSVIILSISAFLQVASCALAAYGFARYKFPGRNILFMCVFLIIVVPPQTIMSSLYLNFQFFDIFGLVKLITGRNINLLNTLTGYYMLSATGMGLKSGLYIFLLRQYFRGVPKELEEAAYVDGCGRFHTFVRIMLPDAAPMLTSCFLFSFVWQWTDTLFSVLFLRGYRMISIGLSSLNDGVTKYWAEINRAGAAGTGIIAIPPLAYSQAIVATGMLLCVIPLIILYLAAQKAFVESLSQSGIKM
uniref:Binding-protein-dependent transport systems inner membrane component n=1 Tax=uncultured bacterium contig00066 TaxID=1181548 RepID=A0A806KMZ6_9BACT|nr:binding-protein-dependent transport systems inner membrane component [uncultured bacterium contig00066]